MDWDELFQRFLIMNMVNNMSDKTCKQQREIVQTAIDNTMETAKCISEIERLFDNKTIGNKEMRYPEMKAPRPIAEDEPEEQFRPETVMTIDGLTGFYNDLSSLRDQAEDIFKLVNEATAKLTSINAAIYKTQLEIYKLIPKKNPQ